METTSASANQRFHGRHGFPRLSLANPRAQALFPEGQCTSAFGNTPGVNLLDHFETTENEHLDLLLLGSGDLRNVFFTISELVHRKPLDCPESLSFHINDHDPSIVARNVIILEIAKLIDVDSVKDVDFIWNVWYSLALSDDENRRLKKILEKLVSPHHATSEYRLGSEDMLRTCRRIWTDWAHLDLKTETASLQRNKLIARGLNLPSAKQEKGRDNWDISAAKRSLANTAIMHLLTPLDELKLDRSHLRPSGPLYEEILSYFITGSSMKQREGTRAVNPTLICPFEHTWKVHYGSCPFSGYNPIERELLESNKSVTKACKAKLKMWVKDLQTFSRSKTTTQNSRMKVTLWIEDALQLCRTGLPKDLQFDIIDTSNLSDHIGLLNILVCWGKRLKEPGQSQLFTSTMLWRVTGHSTLDEYLESSIGIHSNLFPTILGLQLAEDLDLGSSDSIIAKDGWRVEDRLIWVRAVPERSPISIDRSPDILSALKAIASRCCRLPSPKNRCLQLSGVTLASPTTFFAAFAQILPEFQEPAAYVLSNVEEALPNVRLFHRRISNKFGTLSWNVLKSAIGLCSESVLKIDLQVVFPISAHSRTTPVLQAVLFEDPADAIFLSVWPVWQLEKRRFQRPVHLFYNNVRYEDSVASFLVLENDWKSLHSDTVLILLSSSGNFKSDAIKVKHVPSENEESSHCFSSERFALNGTIGGSKEEAFSKKRRRSRVKRNMSFLKVNCMSKNSESSVTKRDVYQMSTLPKGNLVNQKSCHLGNSTDCLLTDERGDGRNEKCFDSGIISVAFKDSEVDHQVKKEDGEHTTYKGGNEIETRDSGNQTTTWTTVQRVQDIRKFFGFYEASPVSVKQARNHVLELLVLEEHTMCYNAEVRILNRAQNNGVTMSFTPNEMPTAAELSVNGDGSPMKLFFAAPVDEVTSKVRILESAQKIRCHFPKKEFAVSGRLCIRKQPMLNYSGLSRWRNNDDLALLMNCACSRRAEGDESEGKAFGELQNVLECIIASFVECPEKNSCFTVHEPHDTDGTAPDITIVVEEVFKFKNLPLAKVLFCDHKIITFPSKEPASSDNDTKFKGILSQLMENRHESPMINATKEGQILLRKLLHTNAKRVRQSAELQPVWINSLLQLRFQRKPRPACAEAQQYGFRAEEPEIFDKKDYGQSENSKQASCYRDVKSLQVQDTTLSKKNKYSGEVYEQEI